MTPSSSFYGPEACTMMALSSDTSFSIWQNEKEAAEAKKMRPCCENGMLLRIQTTARSCLLPPLNLASALLLANCGLLSAGVSCLSGFCDSVEYDTKCGEDACDTSLSSLQLAGCLLVEAGHECVRLPTNAVAPECGFKYSKQAEITKKISEAKGDAFGSLAINLGSWKESCFD